MYAIIDSDDEGWVDGGLESPPRRREKPPVDAEVVDLEAEMDHRLQDMASRYMFATNAEMNTGLDREMADLGVGIRKTAARRQERGEPATGGQGSGPRGHQGGRPWNMLGPPCGAPPAGGDQRVRQHRNLAPRHRA